MDQNNIGITGLIREYPKFKYSTKELIDILGNKLSEKVKENIFQLGVKERYFTRPIESYIETPNKQINSIEDNEPISDLSAKIINQCLEKLGLKHDDITCLVAGYENNDYLSPGLGSITLTKSGFSKFLPHYNIQGMACSTLPKLLELGKNLIQNENDKVLVVISGCNSGWYLPHLKDNMSVKNPKEIGENQYDREKQINKWVSTMFSFLFGDGVSAFVLSKVKEGQDTLKIGKITHAVNFDNNDYKKACVRLVSRPENHHYEYELTAGGDILSRSLEYSKKVMMKSFNKPLNQFDESAAKIFMESQKKVMIHTGSSKIIDGFKNLYNLSDNQIKESYETLQQYGNLTGCSLPTVLNKALTDNTWKSGKGLLVGITMGFGLDLVEVEKISN
jgi:3-oxoacyl-[acyl-carrier-protein] synthase III